MRPVMLFCHVSASVGGPTSRCGVGRVELSPRLGGPTKSSNHRVGTLK